MRIIAVMSPKGGIGKTTTSDAIAYMLGEEQEKRVLILDGDPQGDTSKTFEAYEPEGTGMSELLERHVSVGGSYRTTDLIRPTQYSHIDIIPANGYLMQTDMKLLLKQEANQVTRLRDALEEISEAYDYSRQHRYTCMSAAMWCTINIKLFHKWLEIAIIVVSVLKMLSVFCVK